jgi:Ala-tRNA(Pro) deacylase
MLKVGRKTTKHVLAVVPGDRRVDPSAIRAMFDASYVSFASPQMAEQLAGCALGTVLPFAMHNDVEVIADPALFQSENICFNAARLDCSVSIRSADYRAIAKPRVEPMS